MGRRVSQRIMSQRWVGNLFEELGDLVGRKDMGMALGWARQGRGDPWDNAWCHKMRWAKKLGHSIGK
jgi:hypothetical protein